MSEIEVKAEYEAVAAEKLNRLARRICSGSCKSMEDYKQKCGEFRAIEHSVEDVNKIVQRLQRGEEIDNLDEEAT